MSRLHALGLPVPMPVAARYRRSGLTYSADLLTSLIPDARPLVELLALPGDPDFGVLERVADTIAALHAHQVWHADLNAHNILVDATDKIWLIDFDRAREGVASAAQLAGNLDRLLRSLRKLLPKRAFAAVEKVWPQFVARYQRALSSPDHLEPS